MILQKRDNPTAVLINFTSKFQGRGAWGVDTKEGIDLIFLPFISHSQLNAFG